MPTPISASVIAAALLAGLLLGLFIDWALRRGQRRTMASEVAERERSLEELRKESGQLGNDLARAQEQASQLPELRRQLEGQAEATRGFQAQIATLQKTIGGLESSVDSLQLRNRELDGEVVQLKTGREELLREEHAAKLALAEANTNLENERSHAIEKLAILNDAREQLSNQFKVLASEILEEKSRTFTEQNQTNLGNLLAPLREKITAFQSKVEEAQKESIAGRSELREQIGNLRTLNERLSQEASSLVTALKGSSQVQGSWGEHILESLLDACGLQKDREYVVQESLKREDGTGARLDVLVKLPGGRHLIIDSKVSLGDYVEYCNSEAQTARDLALKRHVTSMRAHLKSLSERDYQSLYQLTSLDFVIMFVPIEPAFMLAISHDTNLWNEAWNKNVLLVSPSTLLFVIRTVAHLWKQEQQTQNVQEIAKRGGDLYDKLVGFVEDLKAVGNRLVQAKDSYDDAFGKLYAGRGNLIRQAELMKLRGAKAKKAFPAELTAAAFEDIEGPMLDFPAMAAVEDDV
jgi:DNA recombination protein RmuC